MDQICPHGKLVWCCHKHACKKFCVLLAMLACKGELEVQVHVLKTRITHFLKHSFFFYCVSVIRII